MPQEDMISIQEFCMRYSIEQSFVYALYDLGLVQVIQTEQEIHIPASELNSLERMVRLNTEMGINIEGIEAISHLLQKVHDMQQQIKELSNRLSMYED